MNKLEQCKIEVLNYFQKNGRVPKAKDITRKNFSCHSDLIRKNFKDYNEFLTSLNLPIIRDTKKSLVNTNCTQCNLQFQRCPSAVNSLNNFCSHSCSATYANLHKHHGTRRSLMEIFIQEQIKIYYPHLVVLYNDKTIINSELDFYFPDLKLAIELNGIFHYEPIYGMDKFIKIQNNDKQKSILCYKHDIEFCSIDTSSCNYLNQNNKDKFWKIFNEILSNIINRLNSPTEN